MPLINNVSYSWSMIEITAPALTGAVSPDILNGIVAIKYSSKQNVKDNYGLHGKKVGRGFGNIETSASITMDYNTQVALRNLKGSLRNLGEFNMILSFGNAVGDGQITSETVTLEGCFFDEDAMEANQDDTNITHEFDLHPYNIIIG